MIFTFADPTVRQHSILIQRLSADLARVRLGAGPTSEELDAAPIIDSWQLSVRAEPALLGYVSGHPLVAGHALTSGLHLLNRDLGYARTLSRWYRLGREAV